MGGFEYGLDDHILDKKKGKLFSPLNKALGENKFPISWRNNVLPEILWIALIFDNFDRKEGLEIVAKIFSHISETGIGLKTPKFSSIILLTKEDQEKIYDIITIYIDKCLLSPLTSIFRNDKYSHFFSYFNCNMGLEYKISKIRDNMEKFQNEKGNNATDIRFLALYYAICQDIFKISIDMGEEKIKDLTTSIHDYPLLDHENNEMRKHRPTIRTIGNMLLNDINEQNDDFLDYFWLNIGLITDCESPYIEFSDK
ncbi:MAG: hypothetical protein KO253_08100 [Methanobrevibacter arboriphilus]|nr:hypothetical protein [Methanobrevibacter arboriphilus]